MPLESIGVESDTVLEPAMYTAALCSGAAALKSLREANVRKDDVVLVFGVGGGIGHLAGMIAKKIFGARVVGVDRGDKAEALKKYAAHDIYDLFVAAPESLKDNDAFPAEIYKACASLRGGCSDLTQPDAIVMAASSEDSYRWANLVRDKGVVACLTYVSIATPCVDLKANRSSVIGAATMMSVKIGELVERQICIKGVMMGGAEESYQVIQYIKNKQIKPVITKVALKDMIGAVEKMTKDGFVGKLVVTM